MFGAKDNVPHKNIYKRYVSGEHDRQFFNNEAEKEGHIKLRPLSGQFDVVQRTTAHRSVEFLRSAFQKSSFFGGFDSVLFGNVITALYKHEDTNKLCAISITKYGTNVYENIMLEKSSRFWPACENLDPEHRSSNVRRALAITNLKNFNKLWNNKGSLTFVMPWDETNAGALASKMTIINHIPSTDIGDLILTFDLVQGLSMSNLVVDVIYDNDSDDKKIVEDNNTLVTILGKQMEQLFDPLLEYSPQALDYVYVPSTRNPATQTPEVENIIKELVEVQSRYTMDMVAVLQDFIIPLRVHILSDPNSVSIGAMKVNAVFPPTIDEITRINCIFNNSLLLAAKLGYEEVFEVLSSFLPFFFKALVRHQANTRSFPSRFESFVEYNYSYAFGNKSINRLDFTPETVKNIIMDSVLELHKLKSIIEKLFHSLSQDLLPEAREHLQPKFDKIMGTIRAIINGDELTDSSKKRVLTPSGKILALFVSDWPQSLHFGWISRKVIAVHELKDIAATEDRFGNTNLLIIFSDYIVILEVHHDSGTDSKIPLPEILMNSLMNQVQLPPASILPKMRAIFWCDVQQVLTKSYQSPFGNCLTIMTYGQNRFRPVKSGHLPTSLSYAMLLSSDSLRACNKIMSHICKAQIMHKSTPFHLFQYESPSFTRFYCAHGFREYLNEVSKSVVSILLNIDKSTIHEVFETNPQILIVFSISFVDKKMIQVVGLNRDNNFKVEQQVAASELNAFFEDHLSKAMDALMHSSSFATVITKANESCISQMIESFPTLTSEQTVVSIHDSAPDPIPEAKQKSPSIRSEQPTENKSRRKSRASLSGLLGALRNKHDGSSFVSSARRSGAQKTIANSGIPRGKKPAFKSLYKIDPALEEASTATSVVSQDVDSCPREYLVERPGTSSMEVVPQPRVASRFTTTSSHYTSASKNLEDADITSAEEFLTNLLEEFEQTKSGYIISDELINVKDVDTEQGVSSYDEIPNKASFCSEQKNSEQTLPSEIEKAAIDLQLLVRKESSFFPSSKQQPVYRSLLTPSTPQLSEDGGTKNAIPQSIEYSKVPNKISPQKTFSKQTALPQLVETPTHEVRQEEPRHVESTDIVPELKSASVTSHQPSKILSPEIAARYSAYDLLPISIFDKDDDANWTALPRDSCSDLQAELSDAMTRLQNRAYSNTPKPQGPITMQPFIMTEASSDETSSTLEAITYVAESSNSSQGAPELEPESCVQEKADKPATQILDFDFVDDFCKDLERSFSVFGIDFGASDDILPSTIDESTNSHKLSFVSDHEAKKASHFEGMNPLSSSEEEEYYSSHDYNATVDRHFGKNSWDEDSDASPKSVPLSDITLFNESLWASKALDAEFDGVTAKHFDLDTPPESLASLEYLSDIFTGRVTL